MDYVVPKATLFHMRRGTIARKKSVKEALGEEIWASVCKQNTPDACLGIKYPKYI